MSTMLKVSEAASLALHTMRHLAENADSRLTAKGIASALHVSGAHLSKVLQRLARAGLVKSVRGPKGGFTLGKDPGEITLLDVYELVEGPLAVSPCLLERPICTDGGCMFGDLIETVNGLVAKRLAETALSDVASANGGNDRNAIA